MIFFLKWMYEYERDRRGRDHMVVGFTTTFANSAYHHWCCDFESQPGWGVQHYVIKFVSDLHQVGGFLRVLGFPPPIKLTRHNITEILLKVTLNTIKPTNQSKIFSEIKSTTQLQANSHFTLILGYELCLLLKTLLWKWNVQQ